MAPLPLLCLPFLAQTLLMSVDEFRFHWRRGLPAWEIWGHPLDTLTAIGCIAFLLRAEPTERNAGIYIGFCIFSALLATKDEFVHRERCTGGEQWVHSVLFMLHPTVFFCSGFFWWGRGPAAFLQAQAALIFSFFLYQTLYWSKPWRFLKSTTASTKSTGTAGTPPATTP